MEAMINLKLKIVEAAQKLTHPPSSVDELLTLLEDALISLKAVKDWPANAKNSTFYLLKKALINKKLVNHSEFNVKVAVSACISEIARIVAPEDPYEGWKMKEAFKLIVSLFGKRLISSSSKTLSRIASMLKTLSNLRLCVVMIDLGCHELITEMIENFLKTISYRYPQNVFPSMAKIMTLVLQESINLPPWMLLPILRHVREHVKVSNASRRLAEKVLSNCAFKLKGYLPEAVVLSRVPLENYSTKVAMICTEYQDQLVGNQKEALPSTEETYNVSFLFRAEKTAYEKMEKAFSSVSLYPAALPSETSTEETYNMSDLFRDEERQMEDTRL